MTIHQIDQNTTKSGRTVHSKRLDSEVRHAREIVTLLDKHAELRGVYAMADFFDESVRWTA